MTAEAFRIRPAEEGDRMALAQLLADVAEERNGIAAEPPLDVEAIAVSMGLLL